MVVMPDRFAFSAVSGGIGRQLQVSPDLQVERPWTVPAEAVVGALATDPVAGLTARTRPPAWSASAPNELVERGRKPAWRLLAEQFANTMIPVLVAAAVVTAVIGDLKDMVVILTIVVLNAIVRRFVRYLLTTNSGEILVMFLASVLALPVPAAGGADPLDQPGHRRPPRDRARAGAQPSGTPMRRRPRSPTDSIFARGYGSTPSGSGSPWPSCALPCWSGRAPWGWPWQTMVFTSLALLQLGHALAVGAQRESFFTLGPASTPCCSPPWARRSRSSC
jgi:Cation transporter/ATPase, N-terminus